jgi:glycosyltransferase involved in cell wall biosynthesis
MRILMAVPHTLPSPDGGHGCPVMSWAMLKWFQEAGHEIALFAFAPTTGAREPGRARARERLRSMGIRLIETEASVPRYNGAWRLRLLTARQVISPKLSDYLADAASHQRAWEKAVEAVRPDAFWLYTSDAAALAHTTFPEIPRLASLIDLDHEARELKRSLRQPTTRNKLRNLAEQAQDRLLPSALLEILKGCEVVVEHSIASAQWLQDRGVAAHYFPNPVEADPLPRDWFDKRERLLETSSKKRILMVGHLRGIATQTGLRLLADEILPSLERDGELGWWEISIVGGGELPPDLASKLNGRDHVRLCGFVEQLAPLYQESHVNLVAVKEKIGFRTRLVEAFAHASPSVVHTNNRYGMPELQDEQNCLLADTGEGLSNAVIRVLTDERLRQKLEERARQTYDEYLNAPVVMNKMFQLLEGQFSTSRSNAR